MRVLCPRPALTLHLILALRPLLALCLFDPNASHLERFADGLRNVFGLGF
ncbi:MAG: hypothetical protein NUW12_08740 [Firmicutes bacterium]|nr:hypothetical protein [Bacillota bacterium]MDH7496068.1 hypothetical protein [Bacillota bacterium]